MKSNHSSIKAVEVTRALRKGQATIFNLTRGIRSEASLIERAFGLGACALAEGIELVRKPLNAA